MFRKTQLFGVLSLLVPAALLLAGCQSTGSHETTGEPKAVMCDKCKTVWVQQPGGDPHKPWTIRTGKAMVCPDCKSAVSNLFATGKMEHTCKACGSDLQRCDVHNY